MRFFCSRAGPRAAPCLVKIPLYSRPSRFQSAFIISFLKNLSSRSQQPTPRLPARLFSSFLSLRLSLSLFFSPFSIFISSFSISRSRDFFLLFSLLLLFPFLNGQRGETRILSIEDFSPFRRSFRPNSRRSFLRSRDRIKMRIRRRLASLIRIYCDRSTRINSSLIGRGCNTGEEIPFLNLRPIPSFPTYLLAESFEAVPMRLVIHDFLFLFDTDFFSFPLRGCFL